MEWIRPAIFLPIDWPDHDDTVAAAEADAHAAGPGGRWWSVHSYLGRGKRRLRPPVEGRSCGRSGMRRTRSGGSPWRGGAVAVGDAEDAGQGGGRPGARRWRRGGAAAVGSEEAATGRGNAIGLRWGAPGRGEEGARRNGVGRKGGPYTGDGGADHVREEANGGKSRSE